MCLLVTFKSPATRDKELVLNAYLAQLCKAVSLVSSNTRACVYTYTQNQNWRLTYLMENKQVKRVQNTETEVIMLVLDITLLY